MSRVREFWFRGNGLGIPNIPNIPPPVSLGRLAEVGLNEELRYEEGYGCGHKESTKGLIGFQASQSEAR